MESIVQLIIDKYGIAMLYYFILVNFFYLILIVISFGRLKEFVNIINADITETGEYTKPISIIVPAYNEQETIIDNINSLLSLDYPLYEVVVVNDGSTDSTLNKIINYYKMRKMDYDVNTQIQCEKINTVYSSFDFGNLVVIDKVNGGKSDALNAGINISKYPLYCTIDADCIIEKDALLRIVKPFLKYKETIAVGGIVRIANGCKIKDGKIISSGLPKDIVGKFQIIEYFRSFLTNRVGWEVINALLIISGAFGLFNKSAVVNVGGYDKTIGEDMELTLRLHEYHRKNKIKYKIHFTSDAVCWTQAPDNFKELKIQRTRWHRGLIDSLLIHKRMILNPRYGTVGMLSIPYFWIIEIIGPVIEFFGYVILILALYYNLLSKIYIFIFLFAFLYGQLFSLAAILFEEISYKRYTTIRDIISLLFFSIFEQFFYRQVTVWWRIQSLWKFNTGKKSWGTIQRKSFAKGELKNDF